MLSDAERSPIARTSPPRAPRRVLVLQGGGALGAYQVGAYEALAERGELPDWIAGTSIGAINGAIIAGNAPPHRLERLTEFWDQVAWHSHGPPHPAGADPCHWDEAWSVASTALLGQPGLFRPRLLPPWLAPAGASGATSYYDPAPLRATLARLVDWDAINASAVRLSLGVVNVGSGEQAFFDNVRHHLTIEHVLASAALPPDLPPVGIDGEWYWDGGIFSNTPLDAVLDDEPRADSVCFVIDLYNPRGALPRRIDEVYARHKAITYASRARHHIEAFRAKHALRRALHVAWSRLPEDIQREPAIQPLAALACPTTMRILHVIDESAADARALAAYDFSEASLADRRSEGYRAMSEALDLPAWRRHPSDPPAVTVVTHHGRGARAGD